MYKSEVASTTAYPPPSEEFLLSWRLFIELINMCSAVFFMHVAVLDFGGWGKKREEKKKRKEKKKDE